MRWPILRNSLFVLLAIGGISLAARPKKKEGGETEPTAQSTPPAEAAVEATPPTAPPPAPALFPSGVPVAVQALPDGLASLSAQACAACHVQIHQDWTGSGHAAAWRSASFQTAVERAGGATACQGCHLPLANQHARLASAYKDGDLARPDLQPNPAWDATLMSEGVTCAACHVRDGVVIGTHATPGAPHIVRVSEELGSSEFCASCHQLTWPGADKPFYDTYGEWKASAYATAGVRCQDCHLPPTAGAALATRFAAQASHRFPASPAQALSVLVGLDRPEIQRGQPFKARFRLQNTGAGHAFPTGSPYLGYTVEASLVDAEGKALATPWRLTLARTISTAPPWTTTSDTRIPAGGEVTGETSFLVDQKKKAGKAILRVSLYRTGQSAAVSTLQEIPLSVL